MPEPARRVAALMLRTERGPLHRVWAVAHAGLIRALSAYLRWTPGESAVYLRGSFASGEPVYGLSDVDLVVVVAPRHGPVGAQRERVEARWQRLVLLAPSVGRLVNVKVYEEDELLDAARDTVLTHGLPAAREPAANPGPRERSDVCAGALFYGSHPLNRHYHLRTRPTLDGPTSDWRLVGGRDRRPSPPPSGGERLVSAWLELQCWWRYAVWACAHPDHDRVPYLCIKLVGEPARIWLSVAHDERPRGRSDALELALRLMPEDEPVLRLALRLRRQLARSPDPPLGEVIAWLLGFSSRLAGRIAAELEAVDATTVELRTNGSAPAVPAWFAERLSSLAQGAGSRTVPLADWRALCRPGQLDETFVLLGAGTPGPAAIARAAAVEEGGVTIAFDAPNLLLLPSADLESRPLSRGTLRAIQCQASDPVSFALCRGHRSARFPELRGWAAGDWARRAVAEHRAWLASPRDGRDDSIVDLSMLFSAARAGVFLESVEHGSPALPITIADIAQALADRRPAHRSSIHEAGEVYRACRREGTQPPRSILAALDPVVRSLLSPAFGGSSTG